MISSFNTRLFLASAVRLPWCVPTRNSVGVRCENSTDVGSPDNWRSTQPEERVWLRKFGRIDIVLEPAQRLGHASAMDVPTRNSICAVEGPSTAFITVFCHAAPEPGDASWHRSRQLWRKTTDGNGAYACLAIARSMVRRRGVRNGDAVCAVKGKSTQPVRVRPKEVSVRLGSYPGDGEGDRPVETLGTTPALGGPASVRAAT